MDSFSSYMPKGVYKAKSITSLPISIGSKTLYTSGLLDYTKGQVISLYNSDTAQMTGIITSYDYMTGEMQVDVQEVVGTGTYNEWGLNLSTSLGGGNVFDYASTIFVDSNGDDANTGKSNDAPKKTIQSALDVASTSDNIYISNGTYVGNLATAKQNLSIYGNGRVRITGNINTGTNDGLILHSLNVVGAISLESTSADVGEYIINGDSSSINYGGNYFLRLINHETGSLNVTGNGNIYATGERSQLGSITKNGTGLLSINGGSAGNIVANSGMLILKDLQGVSGGVPALLTIGTGVVYSIQNIVGYTLNISPGAIKLEDFLIASGLPANLAKSAELTHTMKLALLNPKSDTVPTHVITRNDTTGELMKYPIASLGGGGGTTYTAGDGIDLTGDVITNLLSPAQVVLDNTITDPSTITDFGGSYIVPNGATGEWATHIGEIASSNDGGLTWDYTTPTNGMRRQVVNGTNAGFTYLYNATTSTWNLSSSPSSSLYTGISVYTSNAITNNTITYNSTYSNIASTYVTPSGLGYALKQGLFEVYWDCGYGTTGYQKSTLMVDGVMYGGSDSTATASAGGGSNLSGATARVAIIDARTANKVIHTTGTVLAGSQLIIRRLDPAIITPTNYLAFSKIGGGIPTSPTDTAYRSGMTGFGTTTPTEMVDVNGNIKLTGNLKYNGIQASEGQVFGVKNGIEGGHDLEIWVEQIVDDSTATSYYLPNKNSAGIFGLVVHTKSKVYVRGSFYSNRVAGLQADHDTEYFIQIPFADGYKPTMIHDCWTSLYNIIVLADDRLYYAGQGDNGEGGNGDFLFKAALTRVNGGSLAGKSIVKVWSQTFNRVENGEACYIAKASDNTYHRWGYWGQGNGIDANQNNQIPVQLTVFNGLDMEFWLNGPNGTSGGYAWEVSPIGGRVWGMGYDAEGSVAVGSNSQINAWTQCQEAGTNAVITDCLYANGFHWNNQGSTGQIIRYQGGLNQVWFSGENGLWQGGDGTQTDTTRFKQSLTAPNTPITGAIKIQVGVYGSFVLKSNGDLYGSGYGADGCLGSATVGTTANQPYMTLIDTNVEDFWQTGKEQGWTTLYYRKTDKTMWSKGYSWGWTRGLGNKEGNGAFPTAGMMPLPSGTWFTWVGKTGLNTTEPYAGMVAMTNTGEIMAWNRCDAHGASFPDAGFIASPQVVPGLIELKD